MILYGSIRRPCLIPNPLLSRAVLYPTASLLARSIDSDGDGTEAAVVRTWVCVPRRHPLIDYRAGFPEALGPSMEPSFQLLSWNSPLPRNCGSYHFAEQCGVPQDYLSSFMYGYYHGGHEHGFPSKPPGDCGWPALLFIQWTQGTGALLPLFLILDFVDSQKRRPPHGDPQSPHEKRSEVFLNETICDHMCSSDFVSNC